MLFNIGDHSERSGSRLPVPADGRGAADSYLTSFEDGGFGAGANHGVSFGDHGCVKSLAVIGTSRELNRCSVHTGIAQARSCLSKV